MTSSLYMLQEKVEELVEEFIENSNSFVLGAKGLDLIGLDFRCGRITVLIDNDCVCVSNPRSIEYYGGWEYIDSEFKTEIGSYTFYDGEASRVASVIEAVREMINDGWVYNPEKLTFESQEDQEDQEEQLRKDEKNGLYPDKWDDAN